MRELLFCSMIILNLALQAEKMGICFAAVKAINKKKGMLTDDIAYFMIWLEC